MKKKNARKKSKKNVCISHIPFDFGVFGAKIFGWDCFSSQIVSDRLCGNCLTGFAAAYVILVVFTCTLLLEASLTNALPLSNTLETGDIWKFLLWPEKVSFMLCLFAWLGMEAFRIFASACMKRVYRIIQELIT